MNASTFSMDELSEIWDQNEINAAKDSLNSELIHWQDGKRVICREWIQDLLSDLSLTAEKFNKKHLLEPIHRVLEEGNQAMKWINQYKKGLSIEQIMKLTIDDMIINEQEIIWLFKQIFDLNIFTCDIIIIWNLPNRIKIIKRIL